MMALQLLIPATQQSTALIVKTPASSQLYHHKQKAESKAVEALQAIMLRKKEKKNG